MKSPDQIKEALGYCALPRDQMHCKDCPYFDEHDCIESMCADARELIQQLEAIKDDFDEYARQY